MNILAPADGEEGSRGGGHSGRKFRNPDHARAVEHVMRVTRMAG